MDHRRGDLRAYTQILHLRPQPVRAGQREPRDHRLRRQKRFAGPHLRAGGAGGHPRRTHERGAGQSGQKIPGRTPAREDQRNLRGVKA